MAKQKNIDIWNQYRTLINTREQEFISSQIRNKPSVIYLVYPVGSVTECIVTGFVYCDFYYTRYHSGKRPTQQDIDILKTHYDANPEMVREKIGVEYYHLWDCKGESRRCSSTHMLYDPKQNKNLFTDKDKAEQYAADVRRNNEELKEFNAKHKKDTRYDYKENGYKFLGWQNGWKHVYFDEQGQQTDDPTKRRSFGYTKEDYPEYGNCREQKHRIIEVRHDNRGSENTVSCPVCMIYWKYDSSD